MAIPKWQHLLSAILSLSLAWSPVSAQVRVTPAQAKGGEKQGEPWAEVPESFRRPKIPQWPLPTDLKRWQDRDRVQTRATLLRCLGEMPPRPDPAKVRVLPREDLGGGTLAGLTVQPARPGRPADAATLTRGEETCGRAAWRGRETSP